MENNINNLPSRVNAAALKSEYQQRSKGGGVHGALGKADVPKLLLAPRPSVEDFNIAVMFSDTVRLIMW